MNVALGSLSFFLVLMTVACSGSSSSASGASGASGSLPGVAGGSVSGDRPFEAVHATSEIGKDGVELSVTLYDYEACTSKDAPLPASFMQLGVHLFGQGPAPAPGTYAMAPTPDRTKSASGAACLRLVSAASGGVSAAAGSCHVALSGTVTLTSVSSDGTASGTFDIVFSNGVDSPPSSSTSGSYHETGSFQGAAACR